MNEADKKEFPFADAPDTAAIVCRHVLEEGAPVTYVSHDGDDGMWQFLCGGLHETRGSSRFTPFGSATNPWAGCAKCRRGSSHGVAAQRASGALENGSAPDAAD